MPRSDPSSYTDKQKRQAKHIEEGYENRGKEAERRAWATINRETHGGKKSGSGQRHARAGDLGATAAAKRTPAERSRSAKKPPKPESAAPPEKNRPIERDCHGP